MLEIGKQVTSAVSPYLNSINTVVISDDIANSGGVIVSYSCGKVLQSKINDGRMRVLIPKLASLVARLQKIGFQPYSISEQTGEGANTVFLDFFSSKYKPDLLKKEEAEESTEDKNTTEQEPAPQADSPQQQTSRVLSSFIRRPSTLTTE